ncbi:MAG: acetate--CoA ligase [Candidatus Pacebacteria bacterium]|nr:acetate--CoA ligase [Candidatus Paceibacterota bacterium]
MQKIGDSYFPTKEFKDGAWLNDDSIYEKAKKDPIKFWEDLAKELFWFKSWKKGFLHKPPYFQWFLDGKINITSDIFEKNNLDFKILKNKTALIWEAEPPEEKSRTFTYQELFKEVCQFANALKKLGVKKGDRVGIYLPVIPEVVISMLACARIGAVHSVVFSAFSPQALKVRLQDTAAKVLITADGYYRRGQVINLKQNADEGIKETEVKKTIVVRRAKNEVFWDEKKDAWYEDLIKDEKDFCEAEVMDAEDAFFILYTSGSTGKPKGCLHVCGGYTVQSYWTGKWIFDFHSDDIFWCTSDPGWITGHTYAIYSPLLNGITSLLFEGAPDFPTPDRWAQIVEKHKVSIFYTAPTAIRMFEKYGAEILSKYKFENLRLLGSVGEPIDEAAWLWYFREVGREKCPIVDTWWQTETGGILITSLPGIGPFKPAFTGLPFPGVKVDILDEKGKPCPKDVQGNLVILPPFSPGMFRGIYKNPEKYLETYWSQYGKEIYFTSDGALKDGNDLIRIIGRVDDVIKVAGHRVSTGELEAAINGHNEISECAVIGVPDEIKGEVPVAFVSYNDKKGVAEEVKKEVIDQIKKEIGPIALPKEVYLVEDLPKTRSGKIMRRILKRLFTGEELGDLSTLSNPESVEKIKNIIRK